MAWMIGVWETVDGDGTSDVVGGNGGEDETEGRMIGEEGAGW
jgi:hypothetical protein